MAGKANIHCSVITPERQVLDTQASAVVMPAHDGQIGILPKRAPLVCQLGIGVLRVDTESEGKREFLIDGGFAQVANDELTILTERAVATDEITPESAQQAMMRADAMVAHTPEETEAKRSAKERARLQVKLARK